MLGYTLLLAGTIKPNVCMMIPGIILTVRSLTLLSNAFHVAVLARPQRTGRRHHLSGVQRFGGKFVF